MSRMSKSSFLNCFVFMIAAVFIVGWAGFDQPRVTDSQDEKISVGCERLLTLIRDDNTTAAVDVADSLLKRTANLSNMLIRKIVAEREQAIWYVEIRHWTANTIANHLYEVGDHDSAPGYYAIAEQTTRLAHRFKLQIDTPDSDVLRNYYDEGYIQSENGDNELVGQTWQKGLDYAAEFERDIIGSVEDFYWARGRLYHGLAFAISPGSYSKEANTVYQQAADSYLKGHGSTLIHADGLLDLVDSLYTAIASAADDPKQQLAKIDEYLRRAKPFKDANLMGYLYFTLASWYANYDHQSNAAKWYAKSAELYRSVDGYSDQALLALTFQADCLLMQSQLDEADKLKTRADRLFLTLSDYGTTVVDNARTHVLLLEGDIAFVKGQLEQAVTAYEQVALNAHQSADDFDSVWQRINSLTMLIPLEPDSAKVEGRLDMLEQAVGDAEAFSMNESDEDDLQNLLDSAQLAIKKPFWFEPFPDSPTSAPDDLTYAPLYKLYYWHESAFYRGDLPTEGRVTEELLRRGLAEQYLGLMYGLYGM